jgi:hypothetical protein
VHSHRSIEDQYGVARPTGKVLTVFSVHRFVAVTEASFVVPANRAIWIVTFDAAAIVDVASLAPAPFVKTIIVAVFR